MRVWATMALASSVALTGCMSGSAPELLPTKVVSSPKSSIMAEHEIFVATSRAKSKNELEVFGGRRSLTTDFAQVDITVPGVHKIGQVETRRGTVADPGKYFTARKVTVFDEKHFETALRADIKANGGNALVFIHGYRTTFDAAVYRMTQIVQDSNFKGTPVLFSWASTGRTLDYVYDNNSATAARDSLEETLRIISRAGAKRIDIVAHSMGNWATMEALRQLAIGGDKDLKGKLGDVILASPDIDIDVFRSQMERYGKPKRPFVLMTSADDKALRISSVLAGDRPRVGDYGNASDLAELGVVVVDLSNVKGDRLSHTKFAENPVMIQMIGENLNRDDFDRTGDGQITEKVAALSRNLSGTLGSAAEIIITTPVEVLKVAIGQ